jgi:hypothetical protein
LASSSICGQREPLSNASSMAWPTVWLQPDGTMAGRDIRDERHEIKKHWGGGIALLSNRYDPELNVLQLLMHAETGHSDIAPPAWARKQLRRLQDLYRRGPRVGNPRITAQFLAVARDVGRQIGGFSSSGT